MHIHWVIVAQRIVCQSSRHAVTHGCTEMIQHGRHYLFMLQLDQVWSMDSDSCKTWYIHEFMQHHSMFLHCQQKAELTSRCSQSRPNRYSAAWLRYTGICVADSAALNWVIHNCRPEVRSGSTLYNLTSDFRFMSDCWLARFADVRQYYRRRLPGCD